MTEYHDTDLESDSNIKTTTVRPGLRPSVTDTSGSPATPGRSDDSKGASIDAPLSQRRRK